MVGKPDLPNLYFQLIPELSLLCAVWHHHARWLNVRHDAEMPNSVYSLLGITYIPLWHHKFSKMQRYEHSFLLLAKSFAHATLHVILVQLLPLVQPKIAIDVFVGKTKTWHNIHPDKSTFSFFLTTIPCQIYHVKLHIEYHSGLSYRVIMWPVYWPDPNLLPVPFEMQYEKYQVEWKDR